MTDTSPYRQCSCVGFLPVMICVVLLMPVVAIAQQGATVGTTVLAPVEVTGTVEADTPEVGDVELTEYTGSHTRVDSAAIEAEPESLGAVVAREAGVQLRQSGGLGSYSIVSFRGASGARTGVYLDGVRLNDASSGSVDLSQLELMNITAIDMYRGSTPVQLGQGHIGGAINLISMPLAKPQTRVQLGVGSFEARQVQLAHQQWIGDWQMAVTGSQSQADNDYPLWNENGTPFNQADDVREDRHNAHFQRQSLLLKLARDTSENIRHDVVLQINDRDQGIPHWRNLSDVDAELKSDVLQFQFSRRVSADADAEWSYSNSLFANQRSEQFDDLQGSLSLAPADVDAITRVLGTRLYAERLTDFATLAFNAELRSETRDQTRQILGERHQAQRLSFESALQYSRFLLEDALLLTPAVRVNGYSDSFEGVTAAAQTDRDVAALSPQLGLRWQFRDNIGLTANIGRHFRQPGFSELYGDRGLYVGNPDLKTESGLNADVGVDWQADNIHARINAFAGHYDDLVVSIYNAQGIGRSENVGKAVVAGIESDLRWQFDREWLGEFNLTLQHSDNRAGVAALRGNQLAGEAGLSGFTRIVHQRGRWKAWYETAFSRNRYFDAANLLPASDYLTHTVGVAFEQGALKLKAIANNLSDERVEDFNGYPKPGRSFFIGVSYSFIVEKQ